MHEMNLSHIDWGRAELVREAVRGIKCQGLIYGLTEAELMLPYVIESTSSNLWYFALYFLLFMYMAPVDPAVPLVLNSGGRIIHVDK